MPTLKADAHNLASNCVQQPSPLTDRQTSQETFYSPHDDRLSDAQQLRGFFLPSRTNGLQGTYQKSASLHFKHTTRVTILIMSCHMLRRTYPIQIVFFGEMTPLQTGIHVTIFRKTFLPASSGSPEETSKLYLFSIYTIASQIL